MNCNPFTKGHQYLIEYASSNCDKLYVFVVEEDVSEFPFADRLELVKKGTVHLGNVTVMPSGKYIISRLTFNDYFGKDAKQEDVSLDTSTDVIIFASEIAPVLNINVRFAGEEPFDKVTMRYNDSMRTILPQYGIEFREIPRKTSSNEIISASRVRELFRENCFAEIENLVPSTTFDYLKKLSAKQDKTQ